MATQKKKQKMGSAGGSAAAGGMNFQGRVAALAIAHALVEYDDYSALALDTGYQLKSVHLETCNEIDDIVLEGSYRVFIQAKRSLPLSDLPISQLSKVIHQFVRHHHNEWKQDDRYVLATSTESSSRIIIDLRKITTSLRLNASALSSNPYTLAEQDVIEKIKNLIEFHWLETKGSKPSEIELINFLKIIWILPLDIGSNGSDERLAISLLRSRSIIDAPLLWTATVNLASNLMENRQSVDLNGIVRALGSHIKLKGEKKSALEEYKLTITHGSFSAGKEVVLFDGFRGIDALCIGEYGRFNEDGTRTFQFSENCCTLPDGTTQPILYRGATVTGLRRFISSNQSLFRERKIVVLPRSCGEKPDKGIYAVAHEQLLSKIIFNKPNLFNCLSCGYPLSEDRALSVEVDEEGMALDVGFIHKRCQRPSLRVLGEIQSELFAEFPDLTDFDYEGWVLANRFGKSTLSQFLHNGVVATAGWQFAPSASLRGSWCVRVNLEDDSAGYVTQRGKVERFGMKEAHEKAKELSDFYLKQSEEKDPWVYTSDHSVSGTMIDVRRRFGATQKLLKCKSAEAISFDSGIDVAYSSRCYHYAPLVLLLSKDTGKPLLIDGAIYFLNDPFILSRFLENWKESGKNVDDYVVSVVPDDNTFDNLVLAATQNNHHVFIDPLFEENGEISSGVKVIPFEEVIEAILGSEQHE